MVNILLHPGLFPKSNILLGEPKCADTGDVSTAFVDDHRLSMLKRTATTTRLYLRQRRMAKKAKVRKDAPGEWIDRRMNSNSMRAALLASM